MAHSVITVIHWCDCKQSNFRVSQGSAATLFMWGWVYKFLMWNFLMVLHNKNYWNRFFFSPSYSKYKMGRFNQTQCIGISPVCWRYASHIDVKK